MAIINLRVKRLVLVAKTPRTSAHNNFRGNGAKWEGKGREKMWELIVRRRRSMAAAWVCVATDARMGCCCCAAAASPRLFSSTSSQVDRARGKRDPHRRECRLHHHDGGSYRAHRNAPIHHWKIIKTKKIEVWNIFNSEKILVKNFLIKKQCVIYVNNKREFLWKNINSILEEFGIDSVEISTFSLFVIPQVL